METPAFTWTNMLIFSLYMNTSSPYPVLPNVYSPSFQTPTPTAMTSQTKTTWDKYVRQRAITSTYNYNPPPTPPLFFLLSYGVGVVRKYLYGGNGVGLHIDIGYGCTPTVCMFKEYRKK